MTRRIVQIAAVGHENDQMWQGRTELFALCDDSTAWYQVHGEAAWVPIPDVPQDTPAEAPDPITELEAIGGAFYRDPVRDGVRWGVCFNQTWLYEVIGERCDTALLRAAAARLLARVRGGAK